MLPRMPCDLEPDTPTTHSRFAIIWDSPINCLDNKIFENYIKLTRRSVWGIDKRSFTKVFKALSRASSPYNLDVEMIIDKFIQSTSNSTNLNTPKLT